MIVRAKTLALAASVFHLRPAEVDCLIRLRHALAMPSKKAIFKLVSLKFLGGSQRIYTYKSQRTHEYQVESDAGMRV